MLGDIDEQIKKLEKEKEFYEDRRHKEKAKQKEVQIKQKELEKRKKKIVALYPKWFLEKYHLKESMVVGGLYGDKSIGNINKKIIFELKQAMLKASNTSIPYNIPDVVTSTNVDYYNILLNNVELTKLLRAIGDQNERE